MSLRWQHCNETNKKHKFIELDGSESKCFVKFAAYEKIIYNTDVSYSFERNEFYGKAALKLKKFFSIKILIWD